MPTYREDMPLVQVAYNIPVEVIVNTETGRVERVVEIDEEVKLSEPVEVHLAKDFTLVEDPELIALALEIAAGEEPHASATEGWPAWDRGF